MVVINFIRGFLMAVADSVPGVSGGTIAFVMGFYDDFINSLNKVISTKIKLKDKKDSLFFLGKLAVGWIIGMGISVLILSSVFEKEIFKVSSLFIGLILFSIPLIILEEKESIKNKYHNFIFALLGILLVSTITYFNPISNKSGFNLSFDHFTIWLGLYVCIAGIIAISAMVLPGISGSTLLLIFGLYASIILTIKELMMFDFHNLPLIIIFGLGIIIGLVTIIPLLKYLLTHFRSKMIYLILGLMIGSLYAVFMGPTTIKIPNTQNYYQAMDIHSFNIVFFLIGGLFIFGLDELNKHIKKKNI